MVVSMVTARMLAVSVRAESRPHEVEEPSRPTQTGLLFLCIQSEKRHEPFSAAVFFPGPFPRVCPVRC